MVYQQRRTKTRERITPVLQSLDWLPVEQRIIFKLLLCTYAPISVKPAGGGGGGLVRQGMGWGFDTFQKCAVKFPAHGHIIPVKCNQISPTRAAHCCQISQGRTQKVLTIIRVTLRRIQKPLAEIPHFVSLIIPFLVKGTKKVSFISLQWL